MAQCLAQVLEDRWTKSGMIVLDNARNATHDAVAFHSVFYTPGLSESGAWSPFPRLHKALHTQYNLSPGFPQHA